ncbi:flagellar basal body protein [Legionella maioricensis]|uniref:Flagellar basal body rod protein FlgB n=1 Tax=Legionella maioricensis TaxID=2896528 RepID=A0A9X2CXG2_9GAMM|nr:flagellar basal body protein [Legionella maioricensis]MCL9682629.1 flagellar basal body protein [Legionella maioricensis]MCL9687324.1 flagellar basal body protein [Legionella maioricensis]
MNSDSTVKLVSLALDAALMRQTAIANNIANINTDEYKTIEVNFEQQLNESLINHNDEDLSAINPFYQLSEHQSSIDEQMALNVQNMTHYRALIKGLNQKLAIMKLALQGTNQ